MLDEVSVLHVNFRFSGGLFRQARVQLRAHSPGVLEKSLSMLKTFLETTILPFIQGMVDDVLPKKAVGMYLNSRKIQTL